MRSKYNLNQLIASIRSAPKEVMSDLESLKSYITRDVMKLNYS